LAQEIRKRLLLLFLQSFEVVVDEQGARRAQRVEQGAPFISALQLCDTNFSKHARRLAQKFVQRACGGLQLAYAAWVKNILLGADEDERIEQAFVFAAIRRLDCHCSLADAADAVQEHAPRAVFRTERTHSSLHLPVAPKERGASRQVVRNLGRECLYDFRRNRLALDLFAIFEQESLQIV